MQGLRKRKFWAAADKIAGSLPEPTKGVNVTDNDGGLSRNEQTLTSVSVFDAPTTALEMPTKSNFQFDSSVSQAIFHEVVAVLPGHGIGKIQLGVLRTRLPENGWLALNRVIVFST